jgi:hypothetical protein
MLKEFQGALRGLKQPLSIHHRVSMVLVAFAYFYLNLWALQMLHSARHYVMLALVLILGLVPGSYAARLIRMAVLSPHGRASDRRA